MSVGYFLNTYPVTSGTFIRREIEALEARGRTIKRYAVRRWDKALVDPLDRAEAEKVAYLLSGNERGVLLALTQEMGRNPSTTSKAAALMRRALQGRAGLARPVAYLAEAALLKQKCRADGVEHLHVHFGTNAALVALLSQVMGGPSFSFTAHGPDEFDDHLLNRYDIKLEHAAFAVAISHYAKMQLLRWGGPQHRDKIVLGRCGLDLSLFDPSPVPSAKTLVCVGRLCPQKGQALIPEAVAPLIAEHPDLTIKLVGDGESRALVESEIARLGLRDHIELLGWADNEKVRSLITESRGLLLPSFAEGLPIVIMEAMALGRPVISTYIAGIPELLDSSCGWIVPPSSTEDLRSAISACLSSDPKELTAMGREGRRRVEAQHDVHGLAAILDAEFERVLTKAV
jgi:glycosyltransferase involved in cell wall biosynthesis